MSSIVRFDNVGLRYGTGAEVLRDIGFRLESGAFMFLVGSSGAGKTSLLRLLYLTQRPTRGRIDMFGRDITSLPRSALPALRRRIGVVLQDFRLIEHLTAFDNIALPLRIAGVHEAEVKAHVDELMAWVGLAERRDARPAVLSGGEQQRVAIARAVIARPDILLADEPTGNVDPDMAGRLLHLFHELNRLGTTVVVATHALHLMARVPSAITLRLDRGEVVDPTGALRNPPQTSQAGGSSVIGWLQPRAQRYRFLPEGRVAGGALPWIIGMMTFLATLALAGGIALSNATASLTGGLSRSFTVQIVEPNPDVKREQTAAVAALLRARADLADVEVLGDAQLRALVEPWLGSGNIGEDLPLPAMIDARWREGAVPDDDGIAGDVRALAPTARIDSHAQWFRPLAGVVEVLKWLAVAIGGLVAIATAAIVALSVRAALSTHRPTIETLHIMGAEDRTVAALFEYRYTLQGLAGGIAGFLAGIAVIFVIGNLLGQFGGGLAGEIGLSAIGWVALATVPLLIGLLTLLTVRVTVERTLKLQL